MATPGLRKREVNFRTTQEVRKHIATAVNGMPLVLNTQEAADLLRCGPQTLRNWRVKGEGPKFCRIGKAIRYRLEDLLSWLERNVYASTTEAVAAQELEKRGFR